MPTSQSKPEHVKSLEATLWEAADRLRSRVDAAEYNTVHPVSRSRRIKLSGRTSTPVSLHEHSRDIHMASELPTRSS
jgi:hypothetical protein